MILIVRVTEMFSVPNSVRRQGPAGAVRCRTAARADGGEMKASVSVEFVVLSDNKDTVSAWL